MCLLHAPISPPLSEIQKIFNDGLQNTAVSAFGLTNSPHVALSAVYGDKLPDQHQALVDMLTTTRGHDRYSDVQEPIYSLSDLRSFGLKHNWVDSKAMIAAGKFLIKYDTPPMKWNDLVGLSVPDQAMAMMLYPTVAASSKCPSSVMRAVQQFESNLEKMKVDLKVAREDNKAQGKHANWADLMSEETAPPDDAHANVSVASPTRLTDVETAVTEMKVALAAIKAEKEAMEAKMKEEAEAAVQRRRDIDNNRKGMVAFLVEGGTTTRNDAEIAAAEKFPYP